MLIPEDLLYTADHEWVRSTEDPAVFQIGISDFAQDQLGDIIHVELPERGQRVSKGDTLVQIESTKSIGEAFAPFDGEVHTINLELADRPELVNEDPYGAGWLCSVKVQGEVNLELLLTPAGYRDLTE